MWTQGKGEGGTNWAIRTDIPTHTPVCKTDGW